MKLSTNQKRYLAALLSGTLFLAMPLFFLQYEAAAGISCLLGLALLLLSNRLAEGKKQVVWSCLLLFAAHTVRFGTTFGKDIASFGIAMACMLPFTAILCVGFLTERFFFRKGKILPALLCFSTMYTLANLFMVSVNLGNLQNLAVYGMCLPLISPNVGWLGEYGMTFLVMFLLSALLLPVTCREKKKMFIVLSGCAAMITTLLVAGWIMTTQEREPDYVLRVATATHEKMDFYGNTEKEYTTEDRWAILKKAVEQAKSRNADLLVLNEEYLTLPEEEEKGFISRLSVLLQEKKLPLLLCVDLVREGELGVNKAIFFDENGEILSTYIKNNLVPFIEAGSYVDGEERPGNLICTLGGHEVNVTCVICFDINDSPYIRKIPQDTELLIAPSWDWDNCNLEQKRTRIRSVECHTTLLKHTYEGFTFASGPYGLYGEMLDNRGDYETVKMIEVPIWEK